MSFETADIPPMLNPESRRFDAGRYGMNPSEVRRIPSAALPLASMRFMLLPIMELGLLELLLNIMELKLVAPPPDMSNIGF